MKLTTTLNRIRACNPCALGWKKLNNALGSSFDPEQEINLLVILETNGVQDMLWCLRATIQDSKRTASELAITFAEESLSIFEAKYPNDNRPRAAIQAAKDFNCGCITKEQLLTARRNAAASASASAYAYAAAYAADAAAYAAAYAASASAYAYAAAYAAYAAAYAAYAADAARNRMKDRQKSIIKMILEA